MSQKDSFDSLLDRWEDRFQPDASLAARVRHAAGGRPVGLVSWARAVLDQPAMAACFAAVFLLIGAGSSALFLRVKDAEQLEGSTVSYRLSIDPVYRLQAMAGASEFAKGESATVSAPQTGSPVLRSGLGWLSGELDLSGSQYQRVMHVHGSYQAAFDDLFVRMLESHRLYREFDRMRLEDVTIDYFELYDLLQRQKQLSEESARLTEELLASVEQVIEPSKRGKYRQLLASVFPNLEEKGSGSADA